MKWYGMLETGICFALLAHYITILFSLSVHSILMYVWYALPRPLELSLSSLFSLFSLLSTEGVAGCTGCSRASSTRQLHAILQYIQAWHAISSAIESKSILGATFESIFGDTSGGTALPGCCAASCGEAAVLFLEQHVTPVSCWDI